MDLIVTASADKDDVAGDVFPAVAEIDDVVMMRLSLHIEVSRPTPADATDLTISHIDLLHRVSANTLSLRLLPRLDDG
jgi:hypothetical protein